ncbi:MAG: helix-turn-helix transcriptional regulator [Thermoanaerobacteraceae bacterium]|nr:helix-turn-helix transcriptional regulator [Thermoanaerobacteraceae bacterium]
MSPGEGKLVVARLTLAELELQVALLARAGLKRWEIAASLGIKPGTVKSQLERITAKLGPGWRDRPDIVWPEVAEEVLQAVKWVQDRNEEEAYFRGFRAAVEGGIAPEESGILRLQGVLSAAGTAYLRQARALQWKLLLWGDGRILRVGAAARFWIKPALSFLVAGKYIRYLRADSGEEPYRPWWLPYTGGRVRAAKAAFYKMPTAADRDYVGNYLEDWIDRELPAYVTRLHKRMQQRWLALRLIARSAGRKEPEPPPSPEELFSEAQECLGTGRAVIIAAED